MADAIKESSIQAQTSFAESNDFASLLKKEFKPKSDRSQMAVEEAVKTLAEQALAQTGVISDDAVRSIEAMIAEIDRRLSDQINQILHH
jgi:type VI secretion system protein ImpC